MVKSSGHVGHLYVDNLSGCIVQSVSNIDLIKNNTYANSFTCHIKDWSLTKNIFPIIEETLNVINKYRVYSLWLNLDDFQTLINTKSDNFEHLSIGISDNYHNEDEYNLIKNGIENITLTCNNTYFFKGPCNLRILDDNFSDEDIAKMHLQTSGYPSRYNPKDTHNDYTYHINHIYVSQTLYDKLMTKYGQKYSKYWHYNSETSRWEGNDILSDPWIVVV